LTVHQPITLASENSGRGDGQVPLKNDPS